jgi:hypothetical protein
MKQIGIAAIPDTTTTARYFERAAVAAGHQLRPINTITSPRDLVGLDCLMVVDPFRADPDILRRAPCPVIGYFIDVHQQLAPRLAFARYMDYVFIAQPDFLEAFAGLPHPSAHWLPLACEPSTHFAGPQPRCFDVGFVGKLGHPGSDRHTVLTHVLGQFATNDINRFYNPREMGAVYSQSKIVFNKSINRDLNMRFFEGLAAGALLVTDRIGNGLDKFGRDGEHYIGYDTAEEAIEKIRYYLAHAAEREQIAEHGQQLMFEHHTYAHRLATILEISRDSARHLAPCRQAAPKVEAHWRSEYMMLHGASPAEVGKLLMQGNLSAATMLNAATAAARGIVRPLRQAIRARTRTRPSA